MMLIDTHCHLYAEEFDADRERVVQEAREAAVGKILLPNIDADSEGKMWELCEKDPQLFAPMMGLHPCYVKADTMSYLDRVYSELSTGKYIAVGEIGIDLYWEQDTLPLQQVAFEKQLRWAVEFDLPVAIHVRNAFDEVFEVMDRAADSRLRGVFHCFSGDASQAQKALSYPNFYLGLGGVLTFKKSGLDAVVNELPISRLVLETDAPYLAPTPHRGKRNEPKYLALIAQKLAEIHEISIEEVVRLTSENAVNLFRLT